MQDAMQEYKPNTSSYLFYGTTVQKARDTGRGGGGGVDVGERHAEGGGSDIIVVDVCG